EIETDLYISIYGGKKEEVTENLAKHLDAEGTSQYQTWVNVSVMRRLGFIFSGGVESAGGIFDVLCVLTIMAAVVAVFAFWNVVIYIAVILVLTIFSGGAAFKFLRGTFIEAVSEKIPCEQIEAFVSNQLFDGSFVQIRAPEIYELGYISAQSSSSTKVFKLGIYFALFIATIFMIFEVVWYFLYQAWNTDLTVLALFGAGFLVGICIMDLGVLLRRQLAKKVEY
ncbi:MAG: hypothetical protein P1Q69_21185, partial [Candidatus Thorarchaeota archaeon]|nr:hypothetical protein [Candidatus Thorarchaeota archaeon]